MFFYDEGTPSCTYDAYAAATTIQRFTTFLFRQVPYQRLTCSLTINSWLSHVLLLTTSLMSSRVCLTVHEVNQIISEAITTTAR